GELGSRIIRRAAKFSGPAIPLADGKALAACLLNSCVPWSRPDPLSASRFSADLCGGLFPVSTCDCEQRSSDRGFPGVAPEEAVRWVHTTSARQRRGVNHFQDG